MTEFGLQVCIFFPPPELCSDFTCVGQSVYWQNIFQRSPDPTFVLLTFIWHAMYAWDEALERLYTYICYLVSASRLGIRPNIVE